MYRSPFKMLLTFTDQRGPGNSPHPAYWAGVHQQHLAQPPSWGRAAMVASELSTARALRKRMKLRRLLAEQAAQQQAQKITTQRLSQRKRGA